MSTKQPWRRERLAMWRDRRAHIYRQRRAGHTFSYIAGYWNISEPRAWQLYQRARKEVA